MSNYTQTTSFTPKDALLSGNPAKLIKGADFDVEFAAIAAAIATKLDSAQAGNPTASVGLAAVNGSASTYMRSDGAPALSQAIVPTWSGVHTFSAKSVFSAGFDLNSAAPSYTFTNTSVATDAKVWRFISSGLGFFADTRTDVGGSGRQWLEVDRAAGVGITGIVIGNTSDNNTVSFVGSGLVKAGDQAGNMWDLGWRDAPVNSQNSSYTFVLADRGKLTAFNGAGGQTYTIPANATTAFPVGTVLLVSNVSGVNLSIAISTDTMFLSGVGSVGTRTMSSPSTASIVKVGSTQWIISGSGIS